MEIFRILMSPGFLDLCCYSQQVFDAPDANIQCNVSSCVLSFLFLSDCACSSTLSPQTHSICFSSKFGFFGPDLSFNDGSLFQSDYSNKDGIMNCFMRPITGKVILYANIEETIENLKKIFMYCTRSENFLIGSCFPFINRKSFLGKNFKRRKGSGRWYWHF